MKAFYVYMMTNRSRAVLYTGITNSLMRRVSQHQNGEIKRFTKRYKVDRLIYYERFNDPRDAITREKEIKGWRREKKNVLVERNEPEVGGFNSDAFSAYASHPERSEGPHMRCARYANVLCVIKRPVGGPSRCSG
jgi:putative endonuclease